MKKATGDRRPDGGAARAKKHGHQTTTGLTQQIAQGTAGGDSALHLASSCRWCNGALLRTEYQQRLLVDILFTN